MATPPSSSKSLRNPSRRNRAPLQDMPLEQFLLPPTTSSSSKLGTSTKRPVSPGTPVLYSPAKRRILNEEGLSAAKSPLSAIASTASATLSHNTPQHHHPNHQHNTARFADALMGPDSPARKLDFGTPKNAAGNKTPLRQSEEKLMPTPETKGARSRFRSREMDVDCFTMSSISQSPSQSLHPQVRSHSQSILSPSSLQSSHYLDFLPTPREVPPPVDPQSEHYPGFMVYQDPHVLIPTLRLTSPYPSSISSATLAPLDTNIDDDSDGESIDSRELVKENLPPRRRVRKAPTAPVLESSQLFSPLSTKSSSVPATPSRDHSNQDDSTPRHLPIFGVGIGSGFGKAQHPPSKEDRYSMRRILEEEVDGEQGDD
ncbi:hypothetical protein NP233_g840 [Leucocoprinus birnbaumii]|uniref:Uncharacterized protein n=1 Tax=Leucocoprinus birnbaumii TaxID=56174 RepID=A0AAD5W135_9AGAR|nr:hypothetical protein NP233_g840 [Leucocoprinus birnbaumii]